MRRAIPLSRAMVPLWRKGQPFVIYWPFVPCTISKRNAAKQFPVCGANGAFHRIKGEPGYYLDVLAIQHCAESGEVGDLRLFRLFPLDVNGSKVLPGPTCFSDCDWLGTDSRYQWAQVAGWHLFCCCVVEEGYTVTPRTSIFERSCRSRASQYGVVHPFSSPMPAKRS